jgi:hypothetical protein
MNRSVIIVFFLCFLLVYSERESNAQFWKNRRYEAVAGFGPSLFFGDVGGFSKSSNILGFKDISFKQTRFDLNFNFKYRIAEDVSLRLSLTYGYLHATDDRGSNEERGYEAAMTIFEPALIGEYYFIKSQTENSYLFNKGRSSGMNSFFKALDFYAFTGIGGLSYTVTGNDALESHGYDPKGFTAVIPVGVGTSLIYSPEFSFGVELGRRFTFTDNLDGYTSQYSRSNDVYYFLNLTIAYKMKTSKNGFPSFK